MMFKIYNKLGLVVLNRFPHALELISSISFFLEQMGNENHTNDTMA